MRILRIPVCHGVQTHKKERNTVLEAQTGFEPVNQGVADQQKNPRNPLKLWGILNVSTLFPPYSTKFKPSSRAN